MSKSEICIKIWGKGGERVPGVRGAPIFLFKPEFDHVTPEYQNDTHEESVGNIAFHSSLLGHSIKP